MVGVESEGLSPLRMLGFDPAWAEAASPWLERGLHPARVIRVDRGLWLVSGAFGTVPAIIASRDGLPADSPESWPSVGDWVMVAAPGSSEGSGDSFWFIEAVLRRRSAIVRADPGRPGFTQVLAANMDVVFIVHSLADAPKERRLEREVAAAWDSGAHPVIVFSKSDVCADPSLHIAAAGEAAPGVPCHVVSGVTGEGVDSLRAYLTEGRTGVVIGPSGVGKSTLINRLAGDEVLLTGEVRASDGKGRHTTVRRELVLLPGGGSLIDTPGLRAFALAGSDEGLSDAFSDVTELAAGCRFRDCRHENEPGCAVLAAVEEGRLPAERLENYRALRRELRFQALKESARLRREEKRKWRVIHRAFRDHPKLRDGRR